MKKAVPFVILASLGVLVAMVHLFWPGGLPALRARIAEASETHSAAPTPHAPAPLPTPAPDDGHLAGAEELRTAEAAYDAGDFDTAVRNFGAARADAGSEGRERATRGLRKALLAWALTEGAPAADPQTDVEGEMARLQARAEAGPSEKTWLEAMLFAAGAGISRKLPFLTQQALSCAVSKGPVEMRLRSALIAAGPRAAPLREAMLAQGFLEIEDPVAVAEAPVAPPKKDLTRTVGRVPVGKFSAEVRERLAKAVELERKGADEFEHTGPDDPRRKEHRRIALDYLKQARDAYEAAQEEDPNNSELSQHLRDVMEMVSHLRKEMNLGD